MKSTLKIMALTLLLIHSFLPLIEIQVAKATPETIYVAQDGGANVFNTIQEAINYAKDGDTIFVYNGTYYEHLLINKSIRLVGEEKNTTIIDGESDIQPILNIIKSHVEVISFTIQDTATDWPTYSLSIIQATNVSVHNNIIKTGYFGLLLQKSIGCTISRNHIVNNHRYGLGLRYGASNNTFVANSIINNPIGIYIAEENCQFNRFYRNNLVNNTNQLSYFGTHTTWDNGAEGNYWSDYDGSDRNEDGIGETAYPDEYGWDKYPLVEPWSQIRVYRANSNHVTINCNYTVASFTFNQILKQISFCITGPPYQMATCTVTVPKELLSPNQTASERWMVIAGVDPLPSSKIDTDSATIVSFRHQLITYVERNKVRLKVGKYYPPTADFQYVPSDPTIVTPVNFVDMSVDGANGTIVLLQWDFGDGNVTVTNASQISHQYQQKRLFEVTLTVTDSNAVNDSITKPVQIYNMNPAANFAFFPPKPRVGEYIQFYGNFSKDEDGNVASWIWDFGDGRDSTLQNPTHKYQNQTSYNVTLTVQDNDGATDVVSQVIWVRKINTTLVMEPQTANVGRGIIITATLSDEEHNPLFNKTVDFYMLTDQTWEYLGSNITDSNGEAQVLYVPQTTGTFQVKSEYSGSETYNMSTNIVALEVTVGDQEQYRLWGLIVAIAVVGGIIAFALIRTRKQKSSSNIE
jgi:nitrous oxidase accessory protein NosD/PKD repeat protein